MLMGFGLPDDRIHGPNEKFHLPNFHKGIETSIRFLAEMSARGRRIGERSVIRIGRVNAVYKERINDH